jgi:hypothetical protein
LGHDHDPEWSQDRRWIAFFSDQESGEAEKKEDGAEKSEKPDQVWAIALNGGEACAVTHRRRESPRVCMVGGIRSRSTSPP